MRLCIVCREREAGGQVVSKHYTHESGCGRCVFFAVDHNCGVFGWAKVLLLFAWHRWFGRCVPYVEGDHQ